MSAAPKQLEPRHEPYSIEIEQGLLGSLFCDNRLIDLAAAELEPEHFFDGLHQRLFEMVCYLQTEGAVTPLLVHAVMKTDVGLIEMGGIKYLAGLAAAAPALPNIRDYARILRDLAIRRALIKIGEEVVNAAYEAPAARAGVDLASEATEALLRLNEQRSRGPSQLSAVALRSVASAEERLAGKSIPFITTGLEKLDKAIGGMQPGDRIGIAARTGMGKSLTLSSIVNGAARSGAPVFIASADMREKQWADRALCDIDAMLNPELRPIYYSKFRNGTLSNEEIYRIAMAQREMESWAVEIDDNPVITLASVRSRARAMARRFPGKQGLLGVDFLQKVEPAKSSYKDKRRDEDLTTIAYGLGDIVRDIGWSLIALIQLKNKDTDAKGQLREDPPTVADIRESGGIEMAFDILASPFRKAFFIERREPEGRNDPGGASPTWINWNVEHREHEHKLRLLGWKNRDGRASDLNLDLWCDPGCAAIRDEKPWRQGSIVSQAQADLLGG